MLSRWRIRNKLILGIALLVVIVATLSATGFFGVYRYRSLVRGLERRSSELPLSTKLMLAVGELRPTLSQARVLQLFPNETDDPARPNAALLRQRLSQQLDVVASTLAVYGAKLRQNDLEQSLIDDSGEEQRTVASINTALASLRGINRNADWMYEPAVLEMMEQKVDKLNAQAGMLPSFLHERLRRLRVDVRVQYRALIGLAWFATAAAGIMLLVLLRLFYSWVFRPLRVLVEGSRRVAGGAFDHRIQLKSNDEMAELAGAMNDMTARFQDVRDDLDEQVNIRTRQAIRNEQMASVGFLAAGVAHEINNPLASIAMCAESLDSRVDDVLEPEDERHHIVHTYLKMIQDEAFRCKEITEKLLDFSRSGGAERETTELGELLQGVIDIVRHMGRFNEVSVDLHCAEPVIASVNPQQIKQVALNLLTNAMESIDGQGHVTIELEADADAAVITFTDTGCGMTEEVMQHLFEPFFTRRRSGKGTGLGMSITYRIVNDHNGQIEVDSDGPGHGSKFRVRLPLVDSEAATTTEKQYQAA